MPPFDIIKQGGNEVRIYRIKNRGKDYYKLSYHWAGQWKQKLLRARDEADEKRAKGLARDIAKAMSDSRVTHLGSLGPALRTLQTVEDALSVVGVPPDIAALKYAQAVEALDGKGDILEAVQYYVQHKRRTERKIGTVEAVEQFIQAQKADHASEKYLQDIRSRLRRFARENQVQMSEHTSSGIEAWLRGLGLAARTRNNFISLLKTFFHWCQREGYLPRSVPTEVDDIPLLSAPTEIHVHDADTVMRVLAGAIEFEPGAIPYLAIGYFAGVRPKEMQRMTGANIRWAHRDIEILDWQAKGTRRKQHRRLTPMQENLQEWLTAFPVAPDQPIATSWTRNRLTRLIRKINEEARKEKKPEVVWWPDVARHSAISNLVTLTGSVDQVALWCGNSRSIIYSHYLSQTTPKEAQMYFDVRPPDIGNIVQMRGA